MRIDLLLPESWDEWFFLKKDHSKNIKNPNLIRELQRYVQWLFIKLNEEITCSDQFNHTNFKNNFWKLWQLNLTINCLSDYISGCFYFQCPTVFFPLIFKLVLLTTELDYIYNIIKRNSKIDAHYTNVWHFPYISRLNAIFQFDKLWDIYILLLFHYVWRIGT